MLRRETPRAARSPIGRGLVRAVVTAASLWLAVGWSSPPAGGTVGAIAPVYRVVAGATHAHAAGHKQGTVAVVVSVAGVVVVIAFLLLFGSISVRRRTRDRPRSSEDAPRPPRPGRGLFG
jgi:hypothetical protein